MYSKRNKKHPKQNTKNINCRDRGTTKTATALPCCTFLACCLFVYLLGGSIYFFFPRYGPTCCHSLYVCLCLLHFIFLDISCLLFALLVFLFIFLFSIFLIFLMGAIYLPFSFLFSLFPPSFPSICTYRCICRCSKIFTDILMGAI